MRTNRVTVALLCLACVGCGAATNGDASGEDVLWAPRVGFHRLRILSPTTLELTLITTKAPGPSRGRWEFPADNGNLNLPAPNEFTVTAGGRTIPVKAVGFKRRVRYAPLAERDLRIGNYLYLQLAGSVANGETVEVRNPGAKLWSGDVQMIAAFDALRCSPGIHVNQVGYVPAFPKKAKVGYFLGSLGEFAIPPESRFQLIDVRTSNTVYQGILKPRRDVGFNESPLPYQEVLEADFTEFNKPGEYRLLVPGLGASFPFFINDGCAAAIARTYALGLYHQRCGAGNDLPFTRFVHRPCHTSPAQVPTSRLADAAGCIAKASVDYTNNARHTAQQLKSFDTSLYPFVKAGQVDVSGGHHDAGDYSKYTINSAGLVHTLVFAADALPGAGSLDNLGIPESGDGKSDLLQEAKWEADFLAKMQDDDGGFYFLVYPRNREYENDVLPDRGDPQIVWPKNTAVTAAAVAALAQTASSPLFKQQFPAEAALYLAKARKGWAFLDRAIAQYGRDGAYQKLTHYGDDFMHDDELAWAACELFLATGEDGFHKRFLASFDPQDEGTRRWGWWRLYESYGRAIRSYAFAVKTGRVKPEQIDSGFQQKCQTEIIACADDQMRWSLESAYGTSFPTETKRFRGGGWYFSMDQAFDLAVASALDAPASNDPRPAYLEAMLENLNYEAGCNPVNICYLTGLGWKRQNEIVHHYAMNDRRMLPPDGIPLGNIQSGFMWLDNYKEELGGLSFPLDGAAEHPYPIYDRWGDSFNVQTEFVVVNQARALATAAFLMAKTPIKDQPWRAQTASIEIRGSRGSDASAYRATLKAAPLDLRQARVVWEAEGLAPESGETLNLKTPKGGTMWIEAEALLPDGRRVFASTNLTVGLLSRIGL